eukprot:511444-Hanusia_phi.AAC.2
MAPGGRRSVRAHGEEQRRGEERERRRRRIDLRGEQSRAEESRAEERRQGSERNQSSTRLTITLTTAKRTEEDRAATYRPHLPPVRGKQEQEQEGQEARERAGGQGSD